MEENEVVIDLTKETLDESWLRMFGTGVSAILNAMFGGTRIPVTVRGNRQEVQAFAKTLSKEKKYLDSYQKFGLDNPKTYRSKFQLNKAVKDFERATGIQWPLG